MIHIFMQWETSFLLYKNIPQGCTTHEDEHIATLFARAGKCVSGGHFILERIRY